MGPPKWVLKYFYETTSLETKQCSTNNFVKIRSLRNFFHLAGLKNVIEFHSPNMLVKCETNMDEFVKFNIFPGRTQPFSMLAKVSEKLKFLISLYAHESRGKK